MTEQRVTFLSGDLRLDGLFAMPDGNSGGGVRAAVVCHPHPQYGGSMHNNVVEAVLAALWELGCATLRFNFRGVGQSEGEYGGGSGEMQDARAAASFALSQASVTRDGFVMGGYSFGARIALGAGASMAEVAHLLAVAPPIGMMDLSGLAGSAKRISLIAGDHDQYCPLPGLRALHERIGAASRIETIAGADHFFNGYEAELSRAVLSCLRG
jgi:alpha/beta superfamily hydrolase